MISASEALGGRAAQVDLASCACVCLFWIAVLGSGKVGSREIRAGKNVEVTCAGRAVVLE